MFTYNNSRFYVAYEQIKNKLTRPFEEYDVSIFGYKVKCG